MVKPKYGWEFEGGRGLSLYFMDDPTVHVILSEDREYWFGTTGRSTFREACWMWGDMSRGHPLNYSRVDNPHRDDHWEEIRKSLRHLGHPDIIFDDDPYISVGMGHGSEKIVVPPVKVELTKDEYMSLLMHKWRERT